MRIIFGKKKYPKFIYQPSKKEARIISCKTNEFISKYIVRKHILDKRNSLYTSDRKLGIKAFVVGSDQVWRPKYNEGHLDEMYLSFTRKMDVKRIAYAASFGTDKWEYSQKQTVAYKQLVSRFNLITVREDSAVKLCVERFGINSYHVLDPTMLLTKEDYKQIVFQSNTSISPGNLFYYILDPNEEKLSFIKKISKTGISCQNDIVIVPNVLYLVSNSFRALLYGYHRTLPVRILVLARFFTVYRNAGTEVVEG